MSTVIAHHRTDIPSQNPTLWLRADKGVQVDVNGKVTDWLDQSGNGYNASQTVEANRPLLVNNALNGKPVLRFDGVNDFMNLIPYSIIPTLTFFCIFSRNLYAIPMGRTDGVSYMITAWTGSQSYMRLGEDNLNTFTVDFQNHSMATIKVDNSNMHLYKNSTLIGTQTRTGTLGLLNTVGYTWGFGGYYTDGDIAEIIIYNQALSDTQRQTVENYLKNKYAI